MKKSLILAATVGGLCVGGVPAAANAQVTLDAEAALLSSYVWRGFELADGVSVQPSLTLGLGSSGFSLNVWGSAALQDRDALEAADELDFTLNYDGAIGESAGFSLGYIQYTIPNAPEGYKHTEEFYAALGLGSVLAPYLFAAYDFGLTDGLYLSAGVAPEIALGESAALALDGLVALSDYVDGFAFHHVQATASVGFAAGALTITPTAGFSYAADEINADNSGFWAGVVVGLSLY